MSSVACLARGNLQNIVSFHLGSVSVKGFVVIIKLFCGKLHQCISQGDKIAILDLKRFAERQ